MRNQNTRSHVMEAEQSTLGALLMDPEAINEAVKLLAVDDLYRETHRKIYQAIIDLYMDQETIDLVTVTEKLRDRGQMDEVGGPAYLGALIESCPSSTNVKSYIKPIIHASIGRQALAAGEVLSTRINQSGEDGLLAIRDTLARLQTIKDRAVLCESEADITLVDLFNKEYPPIKWVVPNMIPEGLVILSSRPKCGKSAMMLSLSIAVALGGRFLGQIPVDQGDVLYLALEDTERRIRDRAVKLLEGSAPPAAVSTHINWPDADHGGIERIERWLSQHPRARLVVIDVLAKFKPSRKSDDIYADDYRAMGALKNLADKHNICVMVLHHQSKSDKEDQFEKISGTTAIAGSADALLVIDRKRGTDEATLHLTGRDVEEEQFTMQWIKEALGWNLLGKAEEVEEKSARSAIIDLLRNTGESYRPKDLADELDLNVNTVRVTLRRLDEEGVVAKDGPKYRAAYQRQYTSGADMSMPDD